MKNKKIIAASIIVIAVIIAASFHFLQKKENPFVEVPVETGAFQVTIPASGTVQPENKISITSPIAGRIDNIIVQEGTSVRKGQILAWMSSTDRAALLDSARTQGGEAIKEWSDVYKPTPIIAPATGVIISKGVVVGQTVSQQTVIYELSDRLIVMADVDETDLGKIKIQQDAIVKVDSFPDLVVNTKVARIAHQSVLKNSINSYEVLLESPKLPAELRAGMTANVHFVHENKEKTILLPTWIAEGKENINSELLVKTTKGSEKRSVRFGLSNGQKIEILEGLNEGEIILAKSQKVLTDPAASMPFSSGPRKR